MKAEKVEEVRKVLNKMLDDHVAGGGFIIYTCQGVTSDRKMDGHIENTPNGKSVIIFSTDKGVLEELEQVAASAVNK